MEEQEYLIPPAPKHEGPGRLAPAAIQMIDTAPMLPNPQSRPTVSWNTVEYSELQGIIKMKNSRAKGDAFRNFIARLRQNNVDIRGEVWDEIEKDDVLSREIARMRRSEQTSYSGHWCRDLNRGTELGTNMIILGVDQSFTSSGIVVLDGEAMVHCEKFVSNNEMDIFSRAHQVAYHICSIADKYGADVVALEGLAFARNGNATRDLAGLQFVIVTMLRGEGYEVQIIPPNTAKKTATGKGNAKKPEMCDELPPVVRMSFDLLGVKKTTGLLDLSDAYWIAKSVDFSTEDGV